MTTDRHEREAGRAHWRQVIGKTEVRESGAEPRKPLAQRIREWGELIRAEQAEPEKTAAPVEAARSVGRFPASYAVGVTRLAMDGTEWKRVR